MRVYLDDLRVTPYGWVRAYTAPEAIALLETGQVTEISLDFDLDAEGYLNVADTGTGLDVAQWLVRHPEVRWQIHSTNPAGRKAMLEVLDPQPIT